MMRFTLSSKNRPFALAATENAIFIDILNTLSAKNVNHQVCDFHSLKYNPHLLSKESPEFSMHSLATS